VAKYVLSPEKEAEMVARYVAGETSPELAEVYFVNRATIINYLHRNGITPRKPGSTKRATGAIGKQAYELREQKVAWKVICRKLNMARTTLTTAANEYKDSLYEEPLLSRVQ
jgi:predicted transcriptional regulator